MENRSIADKIEELALSCNGGPSKIDEYRAHAAGAGVASEEAEKQYKKKMAVTLMGLKNGKKFELDGEEIESPPATIMIKIAEGICAEEGLAMGVSANSWRLSLENLKNIATQITALQSLLRSYSHTAEL